MIFKAIDKRIRDSFSKAALEYDVLTSLHKEIGRELSRQVIDDERVDFILDVGMGTGWLTNRIRFYLPDSQIVGLDFATGMLTEAKKKWEDIPLVQAHALEMPFSNETFDVLTSNLAYQWVNDLDQAFEESRRVLKKDGRICITLFGYETFQELFKALDMTRQNDFQKDFRRLYREEEIVSFLQKQGFHNVKHKSEIIKVRFPDLFGLLRWIKSIGANALQGPAFVGREWLERANDYYLEHFSDKLGCYATFEVIWLDARKS